MIDPRLIRDNAPDYVGTLRINHDGCEAGVDTRRRLYLTRKAENDKVVLAFCHNCGDAGVITDSSGLAFTPAVRAAERHVDALPDTLEGLIGNRDAMAWVAQYGITATEWERFGIAYDRATSRVCLPIYKYLKHDMMGGPSIQEDLLGYQLRSVHPHERGPKYLTVKFSGTMGLETTIMRVAPEVVPCIVVVEDLLSAIKVSRVALRTIPLYGAHIRAERILELSKAGPVVVWLDNDNDTVRAAADRLHGLVRAFGNKAYVVRGQVDPKHYTTRQIKDIVTERMKEQVGD